MTREFKFETLQLHAGQVVDATTKSRAVPIYQTTSFVFEDTQEGADLFALQKAGNIYTRITNPTTSAFEERIAALEGGVGALATASGMAALTYTILGLAHAGDHVVAASTIYGGTFNLLKETLPRYGITTTFVDIDHLEEVEAAIKDNTKLEKLEKLKADIEAGTLALNDKIDEDVIQSFDAKGITPDGIIPDFVYSPEIAKAVFETPLNKVGIINPNKATIIVFQKTKEVKAEEANFTKLKEEVRKDYINKQVGEYMSKLF